MTIEGLCAVRVLFVVGESFRAVESDASVRQLPCVVKWNVETTREVQEFEVYVVINLQRK